jgi:hypothetical protein|tara:strand:+ start:431 stop:562 length:132 start_codon:yes stop_codon:yes gene_type:complete
MPLKGKQKKIAKAAGNPNKIERADFVALKKKKKKTGGKRNAKK